MAHSIGKVGIIKKHYNENSLFDLILNDFKKDIVINKTNLI
jgi:hypothetical protein